MDFIYQYLSKESVNNFWAEEMILELDKENFLSENKYLSEFFYEEFEFENAPKFLFNEKINTTRENSKINFDESYLSFTQNLGGSFINSPNNLEFAEGDKVNVKYKNYRDKVKSYIYKFKQHIFNRDHPINRVTQIFEKIWVKYAKVKINSLKQKELNDIKTTKEINETVDNLTQELQRFVVNLHISLKLFYSRTINYSCFSEEKDELINLMATLVFRTGNIYSTVFELYKLSNAEEINKITQNLYSLKKVSPEELGIYRQYCLNMESLNLQEELLTKKLEELNKVEMENDGERDIIFEKKKIGIILDLIKENKKKCPRYGDREIEETKVNLNFEENDNLIPDDMAIKEEEEERNYSIENIEEELDGRSMSLLPSHELMDKDLDINNSPFYDTQKDDLNTRSLSFQSNKHCIIRTTTAPNQIVKMVKIPKLEKVFNRISYTRVKNIEYLAYPYETAIQLLKQVQKYRTPFEKMMIFASISSEITECINDFWKDLNDYIDNNLLNIEIDQLMTIFIYIIIKSQIFDISVHCKIIKSFTTCITKASMIGYYYSTVEAGVSYISSINNIEELFKNKITN